MGFKGILHGEAVAWGLLAAMKLGVAMKITDPFYKASVERLLEDYGFKLKYANISVESLIANMYGDKKKRRGSLRFILQRSIGDNLIEEGVSEELLIRVLSSNIGG